MMHACLASYIMQTSLMALMQCKLPISVAMAVGGRRISLILLGTELSFLPAFYSEDYQLYIWECMILHVLCYVAVPSSS